MVVVDHTIPRLRIDFSQISKIMLLEVLSKITKAIMQVLFWMIFIDNLSPFAPNRFGVQRTWSSCIFAGKSSTLFYDFTVEKERKSTYDDKEKEKESLVMRRRLWSLEKSGWPTRARSGPITGSTRRARASTSRRLRTHIGNENEDCDDENNCSEKKIEAMINHPSTGRRIHDVYLWDFL